MLWPAFSSASATCSAVTLPKIVPVEPGFCTDGEAYALESLQPEPEHRP